MNDLLSPAVEAPAAGSLPAADPTPVPVPSPEPQNELYQRAYLLRQLLEAVPHHRLTRSEANRTLPGEVRRLLRLSSQSANRLRDQLRQQGHMQATKVGARVTYELTDQGREYLQTLPQFPLPSQQVVEEEVPAEVCEGRRSCLLLQLLRAGEKGLLKREANQLKGVPRRILRLKVYSANRLRREMAQEGLVEILRVGGSEKYRLTAAGRTYLATRSRFPDARFQVRGPVLNTLLSMARGEAEPAALPPAASSTGLAQPEPDVLPPVSPSAHPDLQQAAAECAGVLESGLPLEQA